jgi:hypothetical protein
MFNRRNITIRNEMSEFFSKFERFLFAICRAGSDVETVARYVRRVEWSGKSV